MKRLLVIAVALLAALGTGCSSVTNASTANLSGTYDLALVGDLLFITSATQNELRVLDLSVSPHDFVRAPNPLEPLSIPVLDQPTELARDVRYDANGAELDGPYVYARGLGSPEISVVGADRSQLKELNRVVAASTVTAIAGAGPADGQGASTLYYATWDGTRGTLWSVSIPPADALKGASLSSNVIVSDDNESITSLAVMPDGHTLAVATRSAAGGAGRSVLLDLSTLNTTTLGFPAPLRRIFTHAAYVQKSLDDQGHEIDVPIPAGKRVFGVLDEDSCGGGTECSGLIAVEASTGQIARDSTGYTMVPLTFGRGLISGVTVQPAGRLLLPQDNQIHAINLLGIATTTGDANSTGGEIYFFDADNLRQVDTNSSSPSVGSATRNDVNGNALAYVNGPVPDSFRLADGAVKTQTMFVTYQGFIPGLKDVPSSDADGQRFVASEVDVKARVAVGDLIEITAPDASCNVDLTVSTVEDSAVDTTDPIPAACANRTAFTIRAAGAEPYVVEGSVDGYLGRVGPNETFTYPAPLSVAQTLPECAAAPAYCAVACPVGQQAACAPTATSDYSAVYFYHPPTSFSPFSPAIQFAFADVPAGEARGDQFAYSLVANYQPELIALDSSVYAGWYLPAAVVYYQKVDNSSGSPVQTDRVFVSYPSAQGLIEFDPTNIVPNAANASTVVGYR